MTSSKKKEQVGKNKSRGSGTPSRSMVSSPKIRPLTSRTLEKDSKQVDEDELEGKEEFEKENP
jgi:hypothetical protein